MIGMQIDENGDILIRNGHIEIGENTDSIAHLLIASNRGDFKEQPMLGGEAQKLMGSSQAKMWAARVKKQLETVGISVKSLSVENDNISLQI